MPGCLPRASFVAVAVAGGVDRNRIPAPSSGHSVRRGGWRAVSSGPVGRSWRGDKIRGALPCPAPPPSPRTSNHWPGSVRCPAAAERPRQRERERGGPEGASRPAAFRHADGGRLGVHHFSHVIENRPAGFALILAPTHVLAPTGRHRAPREVLKTGRASPHSN